MDEKYFNSRAHVERDAHFLERIAHRAISTHALTWSATDCTYAGKKLVRISTHALTWSATLLTQLSCNIHSFQLTRSRGARHTSRSACLSFAKFQLTRSRGARQADCLKNGIIVEFQLTRSRGARLVHQYQGICHRQISTHALTWSATLCV